MSGTPANVSAITGGTALTGIWLYLNSAPGDFNVTNGPAVTWTVGTTTTPLPLVVGAPQSNNQLIVFVPGSLFSATVASPVTATIVVRVLGNTSNAAAFTINPPLQAIAPILPSGTVNQPYSASFVTGGTAPFSAASVSPGTPLPPGLTTQVSTATFAGTPTLRGVYNLTVFATDFWGNSLIGVNTTMEIVPVPALTALLPNTSGTGASTLTMQLTGTNFVPIALVGSQQIPNTQAQWTIGGVTTPLATIFDSNTLRLVAIVPTTLLATAGVASITAVQPGGATSNALPFTVLGPTLSTVLPASVPAGSGTTALAITGANFVFNTAQSQSTVLLNNVAVTTGFVDTGTLTASVPAAMLTAATVYSVQVANPGGAVSNAGTFSVLAPAITSLSTTSLPVGSAGFTLTVTGANYLNGSQVSFRGTTLAATFVNSTTLTVTVPASLLGVPGAGTVQVINPGGALSNGVAFTLLAPTLTTISPTTLPVGSAATTLSITGTSFISNSQVYWNSTALGTIFNSSTSLTATLPSNLLALGGAATVLVANPFGNSQVNSNTLPFAVAAPTISSLSPATIPAGVTSFTLTVNGSNFISGSQVSFNGSALVTSFVSSTVLTATVPTALVAGPLAAPVVVTNYPALSGNTSPAASFVVVNSLTITSPSILSGTPGSVFSFTLTGKGGTPPYTWSATGLPGGLSLNPTTGVISGVLQTGGSFQIAVVLRDAANATATAVFPMASTPPPLSISPNSSLPSGVVGVAYAGYVFANGGSGSYTFSLGSGNLPDGLSLSTGGSVSGTPKTPGLSGFSVVVTDSTGATASGDFRVTIQPAPLSVTGGPTATTFVSGVALNITFGGTGGVSPYRCSPGGNLPPGTSFANCVLSGTPTTAGVYTFAITVADSTGAIATKSYTLTITPAAPPALSLSGQFGGGTVGVAYTGTLSATGGASPYTFTGSGLPDGLSLSASGTVSGTPTTAGQFTLSATVTDSKGATASGRFPITISPAGLTIVTTTLPSGVVGVAYSASLSAAGGVPPYSWTVAGLPDGLTATAAGTIGGTPTTAGSFSLTVSVSDSRALTAAIKVTATVGLVISPPPIVITTASAPNGTVGTPYSASFAATGGTPPLTFSATGLPAGLSISAAGTISGTPTAPGGSTIVVSVKDSAGASTSKSFSVTIGLPGAPPLSFTGITSTSSPLQQPRLQVGLGSSYPVDVAVTLTLTFAPDSGADDPTIQFSSGGRTAHITIPAGATTGATDVGVQTGSVSGLISIQAQLQAAGQDVTPTPAPLLTIRIAALAPVVVPGTLTAVRNAAGFTVTLTGYATDRELTQAVFQFNAAAGSNLQTTSLTVPLATLFATYFSGASAVPYGSQFIYTQPFTVTGSTQGIVSVTVTLSNKIGQSAAVTATLN